MKNARYVHVVDGLYSIYLIRNSISIVKRNVNCNKNFLQYFCALVNAISCYNNKTE